MRKTLLWGVVAALGVAVAACGPQRERVIDNPAVECTNNYMLQVTQVEMTDTSTVLHCVVDHTPDAWISIAPGSRIVANGVDYPLLSADGIVPGEQCVMPDSARLHFALTFGPIPAKTKAIDFLESDGDGWKMWGIDVTGEADYFALPVGLPSDVARYDADAEMPQPVMAVDSTIVNVHLLGYRPSMGAEMKYALKSYAGSIDDNTAKISADGTATLRLQLYGSTMFRVRSVGSVMMTTSVTWLAPGETVDVYLDCRRNGDWVHRAHHEDYGYVEQVWDNGCYAALNRAANAVGYRDLGMAMLKPGFADYRMTGEQYTDYIIGEYKHKLDSVAQLGLPTLEQAVAETSLRADLLTAATNSGFLMMYNYSRSHGRMPPEPDSIAVRMTPELMARVESVADAADPRLLLASGFGCVSQMVKDTDSEWLSAPLVKDMAVYVQVFKKAEEQSLVDADMDSVRALSDPFYAKAVAARAAEVKARMDALDASLLQSTPDVADDKIFDAIVAPHRGKVVMVDLWNTWCGPCRRALTANEPEKSGDLKSADIVWVYIADESSPMPEYLSLLPGIKGLHYRLTADQIGKIRNRFEVDGIPYYILVDRDGKAAGRPDLRDHALLKQTLLDAVGG